jgi:hypothetical protein
MQTIGRQDSSFVIHSFKEVGLVTYDESKKQLAKEGLAD